MIRTVVILGVLALAACTPARMVGGAAVSAGQVALGAADVVL